MAISLDQQQQLSDQPAQLELVRVGCHSQVGRFRNDQCSGLRRGHRVVCRTARGIEVGIALGAVGHEGTNIDIADGTILRRMTPEDELLWGHLEALGQEAYRECQTWLQSVSATAILLEVEPLLDGRTLYFHFLTEVDGDIQDYLDQLVAVYERKASESKFASLLEHGCGPGCGTDSAKNGCASRGGCAVCKIAKSCQK